MKVTPTFVKKAKQWGVRIEGEAGESKPGDKVLVQKRNGDTFYQILGKRFFYNEGDDVAIFVTSDPDEEKVDLRTETQTAEIPTESIFDKLDKIVQLAKEIEEMRGCNPS